MFGSVSSSAELGAIPCAIAWLYKGINERRQQSGSRFSVRVSALGISATRPGSSPKDLLAAHKTGEQYFKFVFREITIYIDLSELTNHCHIFNLQTIKKYYNTSNLNILM